MVYKKISTADPIRLLISYFVPTIDTFPNLIFQHPASFLHFTTFSRKKDYKFLWAIFSVMNEDTQKGQLV